METRAEKVFSCLQNPIDPPGALNTLSKRLWNLCWENHFPYKDKKTGITYHMIRYNDFGLFMKENSSLIQQGVSQNTSFLMEDTRKCKHSYYLEMGDCFGFYQDSTMIGVFLGHPLDWCTYYLRYAFVKPEYRGLKVWQTFVKYLLSCLEKYTVDRVELQVPTKNFVQIGLLNKLEFIITGYNMSERWGSLLQFTKFLKKHNASVFSHQFCSQQNPAPKS